ncbi:MAG: GNAT family N-acetyltransferase [candidate division WOR-3 bacterium]|nr:GNAT family N-acetyltransferase [candidate division WOR-3 bacterium]MDH5683937.1 GNAT family N-acetyltransferase [candidate division WOR-3 bacterium]
MMRSKPDIIAMAMERDDMPFLFALWYNHDVMHYADEFPRFRGWSRIDEIQEAWERYDEIHKELGNKYTQLIIKLPDGTRIGESFIAPLKEDQKLGEWQKPKGIVCLIGDIKLKPEFWGKGLASKAMREVVRFAFERAGCGIFLVPPHKKNPAAIRVYEKAGFSPIVEKPPWVNHIFMTLTRQQYIQRYSKKKY